MSPIFQSDSYLTEMREHWCLRDMQAKAFNGIKVNECQTVPINHQKDIFWKGYLP